MTTPPQGSGRSGPEDPSGRSEPAQFDPYRYGAPSPGDASANRGGPPGQGPPPYQSGQYQSGPYPSAPTPGGGYGYAQPPARGTSGMAIAGLVLGILALVLFFLNFIDIPFIVLGVVFSALGIRAANRGSRGKGMARAGLVCAIVGLIAAAVFFVIVYNRAKPCLDRYNRTSSQYSNCLRNGA